MGRVGTGWCTGEGVLACGERGRGAGERDGEGEHEGDKEGEVVGEKDGDRDGESEQVEEPEEGWGRGLEAREPGGEDAGDEGTEEVGEPCRVAEQSSVESEARVGRGSVGLTSPGSEEKDTGNPT